MSGRVQTVLGLVPADALGPTLMHEHLFSDLRCLFQEPAAATDRFRAYEPITLDNLGWIRRDYFAHLDNLLLDDFATAVREVADFKEWGGGTIVDVTPIGIGRDPVALARLARATGVNVVLSTGYYVASTHPPELADMTEDDVTERLIAELEDGVTSSRPADQDMQAQREDTDIRAGIIKVGCTWPVNEVERRVLRAAVRAMERTGSALTIHTGRDERSPLEILAILRDAGARMDRVVLGHLDLRIQRVEVLLDIAASGCYLEWDLFGTESSFYPFTNFDMPSDGQRLDVLKRMLAEGLSDRMLISQDIVHKYRLRRYGGHGYKHILENVVPFMRKKGITREDIEAILVANPAAVLTRSDVTPSW